MTTTPIQTLLYLNHRQLELDTLQTWLDNARTKTPRNQDVQLELDRQQTAIDEQREGIAFLRRLIPMNN